jgi:F0F1-type ATP synthase assembly protein I
MGLGGFLAAAVIVPLVVGLLVDRALHTSPVFILVGLALGIGASGAGLYVRIRQYL